MTDTSLDFLPESIRTEVTKKTELADMLAVINEHYYKPGRKAKIYKLKAPKREKAKYILTEAHSKRKEFIKRSQDFVKLIKQLHRDTISMQISTPFMLNFQMFSIEVEDYTLKTKQGEYRFYLPVESSTFIL